MQCLPTYSQWSLGWIIFIDSLLYKKVFCGDSGGLLQSLHFESSLRKKKRKVSWPLPHWVKTKTNGIKPTRTKDAFQATVFKGSSTFNRGQPSQNLNILVEVPPRQRRQAHDTFVAFSATLHCPHEQFRVRVSSSSQPLSLSIGLRVNPSADFVFDCCVAVTLC